MSGMQRASLRCISNMLAMFSPPRWFWLCPIKQKTACQIWKKTCKPLQSLIQLNLKTARDLRLFGFSWRKCQEFWNVSYKLWFWHKRPMLAQTTMVIRELVKKIWPSGYPLPPWRNFFLPKKYGGIRGFRIPLTESPPLWPHKNFTQKGWKFFFIK